MICGFYGRIIKCYYEIVFIVGFFIITMAGAFVDLYIQISPEGIALRDEKVFRFAHEKKVPIVMLTSGCNTSVKSQI